MAWRQLHDSVSSSRSLASLSDGAERLFWRVLAQTDAWGRMRGEAVKVRVLCVPMLDWTDALVDHLLVELQKAARVQVYENGGDLFLQVLDFEKHQTRPLRNRGISRFPDPPRTTSGPLVVTTSTDIDSESESEKDSEKDKDQKQAATNDLTTAVIAILSAVNKPGYAPEKFRPERVAPLLAHYPHLDVVYEAEQLSDWETYGAGETEATKDGVHRFRNWLKRTDSDHASGNGAVTEVDYPWLPGCEPKQ